MKLTTKFRTTIISFFALVFMAQASYGAPKSGFMTSEVTISTGTVAFTVWYPTAKKAKKSQEPSEYIVPAYVWERAPLFPPVRLALPAGATRNAPIKGGTFPLILSNPGQETGNHMRLRNYPNNELLAAQGYIVVEAGRNVVFPPIVDYELLVRVLDHMLLEHSLRDSIDADKIGARGMSFGSIAVAILAGGISVIPADERVRAIILDEGVVDCSGLFDCSLVTIPVMLRDGSALSVAGGGSGPNFTALENALPRFLVTLDNPSHFGFSTGTCGTVEAQRIASIEYQKLTTGGAVLEPEPRNASYVGAGLAVSIGDTAGYSASIFWNLALFGGFPSSYGDYCGPADGGPATPGLGTIMDNQTMIDTKHALNLGFWKTVFGNGNSKKSKLEKAVEKLDSVISFNKVTE